MVRGMIRDLMFLLAGVSGCMVITQSSDPPPDISQFGLRYRCTIRFPMHPADDTWKFTCVQDADEDLFQIRAEFPTADINCLRLEPPHPCLYHPDAAPSSVDGGGE